MAVFEETGEIRDFTYEEMMERLSAPFSPAQEKEKPGGGGRMLTYIPGEAVIERLNEATNGWNHEIVGPLTTRKIMVNRRDGLHEVECLMSVIRLTIPGIGTHEGVGVQVLDDGAGEDVQKGVVTDGVKNAAKYFGVGLYLYPATKLASKRPYESRTRRDSFDDASQAQAPVPARNDSGGQQSPGGAGQRTGPGGGRPATDAQKGKIGVMIRNSGASGDEVSDMAEQVSGGRTFDYEELTLAEASAMIDLLSGVTN